MNAILHPMDQLGEVKLKWLLTQTTHIVRYKQREGVIFWGGLIGGKVVGTWIVAGGIKMIAQINTGFEGTCAAWFKKKPNAFIKDIFVHNNALLHSTTKKLMNA